MTDAAASTVVDANEPSWEHLAELYEPDLDDLPREIGRGRGWVASLERLDGRLWMAVRYERDAWRPTPFPGVWSAPRVVPRTALALDSTVVMHAEDRNFERTAAWSARSLTDPPLDAFTFLEDDLVLSIGRDREPPDEARLLLGAPLGRPDGARWHVANGRFAGDGFGVLPGDVERFTLPAGRDRALTFGYFATPEPSHAGELVFRVLQDGEERWSAALSSEELPAHGELRHARVELHDTERATELVFEVDGPFAYTGFAAPVVGPRVAADAPAVALDGRPNLVLFVADTLRADAFVSQRRLADAPRDTIRYPGLEALAERSLVFDDAWSTSTWTLPAHASMFTSLLPPQHGAYRGLGALSRRATTLAEVLRRAGYRTVATTDGTYVASPFGLDQGFEVFDQINGHERPPLDRARAALERGDGRPTFLFVHSYYPHGPYVPSDGALERFGADDAALLDFDALQALALAADTTDERRSEVHADLRALYFAQLFDFDDEFAAWLDAFDRLGWRDSSHLLFTSDHGEAFGDHGRLFHTGELYESQWRVPLLLSGPGVAPGRRTDPASGIDLAPTFAALAGVDRPDAWLGRDLLRAPAPDAPRRAVWGTILLDQVLDSRQFAFTDGRTKVMRFAGDDRPWAFDLADDPDELARLAPEDPDWPRAFDQRFDAELPLVEAPVLRSFQLERPSDALVEQLKKMGYLGD